MMADASLFMLSITAAFMTPASPPEPPLGNQPVVDSRTAPALPFRLALVRGERPPRSLHELVDRIYRALPPDRLDMFAAFHGGNDFERLRARYDSTVSFYSDLRMPEILHEAGAVWGFTDNHFPLDRARRCVGDSFVSQVAIQIGSRRLLETSAGDVPPPLRNTAAAYGMAGRISRQLFAQCDRLYSPDRTDRTEH